MEIWNRLKQPPKSALKEIKAGRLKGKSDINPMWRYQVLTEVFGQVGIGWKYTIDKLWTEPASYNQVFAFANITLYVKKDGEWSDGIPANGGSMLISLETKTDWTSKEKTENLYSNDEAFKMAITDGVGTAMNRLGVAADVYFGKWDGSKYLVDDAPKPEPKKNQESDVPLHIGENTDNVAENKNVIDFCNSDEIEQKRILTILSAKHKYEPKKPIFGMNDANDRVKFFRFLLAKEK